MGILAKKIQLIKLHFLSLIFTFLFLIAPHFFSINQLWGQSFVSSLPQACASPSAINNAALNSCIQSIFDSVFSSIGKRFSEELIEKHTDASILGVPFSGRNRLSSFTLGTVGSIGLGPRGLALDTSELPFFNFAEGSSISNLHIPIIIVPNLSVFAGLNTRFLSKHLPNMDIYYGYNKLPVPLPNSTADSQNLLSFSTRIITLRFSLLPSYKTSLLSINGLSLTASHVQTEISGSYSATFSNATIRSQTILDTFELQAIERTRISSSFGITSKVNAVPVELSTSVSVPLLSLHLAVGGTYTDSRATLSLANDVDVNYTLTDPISGTDINRSLIDISTRNTATGSTRPWKAYYKAGAELGIIPFVKIGAQFLQIDGHDTAFSLGVRIDSRAF